ncbi:MAG: hypothetical protein KIH64_014830 [Mycobacterium sp.]|nr:hypothetical protein [Mycobacterium sp.]
MSYTDFVIWKLVVLLVVVFAWGVWRGLTGQPLQPGRLDPPDPPQE